MSTRDTAATSLALIVAGDVAGVGYGTAFAVVVLIAMMAGCGWIILRHRR